MKSLKELDIKELQKMIKNDQELKKGRYVARKFYYYDDYKDRFGVNNRIDYYSDGEFKTVANKHKTDTNFNLCKIMIDQKKDYMLSKQPQFKLNAFEDVFVWDMLDDMTFNASLDSRAWLHFYTEGNKLDWIIVKDLEIMPIMDNYDKNIIAVVRYYNQDENTMRIEVWDMTGVRVFVTTKEQLIEDYMSTHYRENECCGSTVINASNFNFGFIPFIPLYNNKSKRSDTFGVRELLYMYNSISCGFIDNVWMFQEALMKLKGFAGNRKVLEETQRNMQKFKMIALPGDADAEMMAIDIPVEAREVILSLIKEAVFSVSQTLDTNKLYSSAQYLNETYIKTLYSPLNTKCNNLERQLKLFYSKFVDCVNKYYKYTYNAEIKFFRDMLVNDAEMIANCNSALQFLSLETVLERCTWVSDPKIEMQRLDKQKQENQQNFTNSIESDKIIDKNKEKTSDKVA